MSIQAVAWALNQPVQDPAAKLVLISLCNAYNADHGTCHPSHGRLAQEATVSVATVKRKLKLLCDEGWIEAIKRFDKTGRQVANGYRLFFDQGGGQNELPGGQSYDLGEGVNCDLPLKKPEEISEGIPPISPKGDDRLEGDFQIIWDSWPNRRNTSRKKALSAYRRLSASERDACFEGAVAFAAEQTAIIEARPEKVQFCPHLSTFINQRRWETILEAAE